MENKNTKGKRFFCSVPGFLTLFAALLLSALCALRFGSAHLSWAEFFGALFFEQGAETDSLILYSVRLPRILAGVLAGVGLSVSGVLLQGVTDNALASPNVIGVNAGAGFGVMLTLAVLPAGLGALRFSLLPVFAFAGAFLTTLTVVLLSRRTGAGRSAIVLSGVAMSALLNALISGMTLLDPDILSSYNAFSIGGFRGVQYGELILPTLMILICFLVSLVLSNGIDLLSLGGRAASVLGVPVGALRTVCILCASASAAAVVSFAGLLGFVGLIVPHMARRLVGNKTSYLLLTSALLGATVTVLADLFGRVLLAPTEIPVGITMALLGAPFFIFLLFQERGGDL
ncbi:MAG: iron ABC transporter permease [Clostridia bacterium]|nr:iron ABC transporter permease [Clostridia bacterium]